MVGNLLIEMIQKMVLQIFIDKKFVIYLQKFLVLAYCNISWII